MRRLRKGEWLAGVSAVALAAAMFAAWSHTVVGVYVDGNSGRAAVFSADVDGWSSLGWAALTAVVLAILAGGALVALAATHDSPTLPTFGTIAATIIGGLATIAVVVELLTLPSPQAGAWIGLAATIGVSVGGYVALADESTPGARERPVEVRPLPPVA